MTPALVLDKLTFISLTCRKFVLLHQKVDSTKLQIENEKNTGIGYNWE